MGRTMASLRSIKENFSLHMSYYRAIQRHPDTPFVSKILLWTALAYALSPIDLIPDFIPVIGYLDDVIIIPVLIIAALWMVPQRVKQECAAQNFS